MSTASTLILLPQITYDGGSNNRIYTVSGDAVQAAAYYLGSRELQTVNINLHHLTGNIVIQASLSGSPTDTDWFNTYKLEANYQAANGTPLANNANASMAVNITGNFVWLRAQVENFAHGVVNFVKVSY